MNENDVINEGDHIHIEYDPPPPPQQEQQNQQEQQPEEQPGQNQDDRE